MEMDGKNLSLLTEQVANMNWKPLAMSSVITSIRLQKSMFKKSGLNEYPVTKSNFESQGSLRLIHPAHSGNEIWTDFQWF